MERTPFLSRSWRALCRTLRPCPTAARRRPIPALEQLERRDCPTQSAMPDSTGSMLGLLSLPYSPPLPLLSQADPLYVVDTATNEVLPSNNTPINTFASWTMNLQAQVSGATVSSYSWSFSNAPDATNISGSSTYAVQFTWSSSASYARNDAISVTETTSSGSPITQSYVFQITGTGSPAWSSAPTSSGTWPSVIAPDQLTGNAATQPAGPYATVGLTDGAVQTSHSMPSYNPNVTPLGLTYSSAAVNRQNHLLQETDALSGATSHTYNLSGWQLSETDPDGNVTDYAYNAAGLLTQTTNPNSYTASYNYDAAGELISYTDYNGRQTDYSYNLAGWKTGETWVSGGYTATYTYNSAGELIGAADSSSSYTYSYDADARITQMQVYYPGISTLGTVTLSYDTPITPSISARA